jgi:hypothetical protein
MTAPKEENELKKIDFYRQEVNNLRNLLEQEKTANEALKLERAQMIQAFQTIIKSFVAATTSSQSKITEGAGELAKMANIATTILGNVDKLVTQQQQQQQQQQTEYQQPH